MLYCACFMEYLWRFIKFKSNVRLSPGMFLIKCESSDNHYNLNNLTFEVPQKCFIFQNILAMVTHILKKHFKLKLPCQVKKIFILNTMYIVGLFICLYLSGYFHASY